MLLPYYMMQFIEEYLKGVKIDSEDGIIDLGCGAGAMLFFFDKYGFGKVSGLEFSEKIALVGNKNIEKWGIDANIIIEDATKYDEYDEYNYFYLFDSFDDKIISQLLVHINNSMARKPRKVTVIYSLCRFKDLFLDDGYTLEKVYKKRFHKAELSVLVKGN